MFVNLLFMLGFMLLFFVIVVGIIWLTVSEDNYSKDVMPTPGNFIFNGKEYHNPLPLAQGSSTPYMIKSNLVERIRILYQKTHDVLKRQDIPFYVSGGTLLGVHRNKCLPMPFDDDIDIHVDYEHKYELFSDAFTEICAEEGLKTLFLKFNTVNCADKLGAGVRICLKDNQSQPVLDIFFVKAVGTEIRKIDGWNGDQVTYSYRERWDVKDVYPLHEKQIDDLSICLPNNPERMLVQQYGENVMKEISARPKLFSHSFPFLFRGIWL